MAYITVTDLQNRMSEDAFIRTFDRNGVGTPDPIFITTCINEGQSRVDMRLGASFPLALNSNGQLVDENVKRCVVAFAIRAAVMYNPLATSAEDAAYQAIEASAEAELERLRKDNGSRLVTSYGGPALPIAQVDNTLQSDGLTYTNPFNRAADGLDQTGY